MMSKCSNFTVLVFVVMAAAIPVTVFAQSVSDLEDDRFFDYSWKKSASPYLEGSFGYGKPPREDFISDFSTYGAVELKIGYSEIVDFNQKWVRSLDERYIFGAYAAPDLDPFGKIEAEDVATEYTRFGFGNRLGYGYKLGPISLLPYNQNALLWNKFEFEYGAIPQSDQDMLNRYGDTYRFGSLAEAGAKLELVGAVSAIVSAEAAVIFPRTVFWEWFGSMMLQYGAQGLITNYATDIVEASPLLGPIIYFVLKNGVSYLFYVGMKSDMNWPFTSETPITTETLKLGLSLHF